MVGQVIGGHQDKMKKFLLHDSYTALLDYPIPLILFKAIFFFITWFKDGRMTYLQSAEPISRHISARSLSSPTKFNHNKYLKLMKPFYDNESSSDPFQTH